MKKFIAFFMAVVIAVSLCACGMTQVEEIATEAFINTDTAYDMTNTFSHDIYEAWFMGINEKEEILGEYTSYYSTKYDYEKGYTYFCNQLDIEGQYISAALEEMTGKPGAEGYELQMRVTSSVFSSCVTIVTKAYKLSGKVDEIAVYVENAKEAVGSLSKKNPSYEHYNDLKYYLAETAAFYDFCCDPEGSFEQVVETFNAYRNDARKYYNVLALFFEDVNEEPADMTPSETEAL